MKHKLSVVISAYNEESRIEACLNSAKWVDEIIVVDNSSTDNTLQIAKRFTDKVYSQPNDPLKIDLQKNTGFEKATGDYILSLDADETIPEELRKEIEELFRKGDLKTGYKIPRKNIIFGKWIQHSLWWPDYQLRLFKKGKGKFEKEAVHEPIKIDGEIGELSEPLIHDNYQTISQYLYKMDKIYTEVEAKKIFGTGRELKWHDAIRYPMNDFLKTYFLQKGYRDGLHGLVLSILQAFYMEIVFAKVWEKQGFKEDNSPASIKVVSKELRKAQREMRYWILSSLISESSNPFKNLIYKIKRKSHKI